MKKVYGQSFIIEAYTGFLEVFVRNFNSQEGD